MNGAGIALTSTSVISPVCMVALDYKTQAENDKK